MVTDGVLHVAAVEVLSHPRAGAQPTAQARQRVALAVPHHKGRCGTQPPQDPVSPRRLTLLTTAREQRGHESRERRNRLRQTDKKKIILIIIMIKYKF